MSAKREALCDFYTDLHTRPNNRLGVTPSFFLSYNFCTTPSSNSEKRCDQIRSALLTREWQSILRSNSVTPNSPMQLRDIDQCAHRANRDPKLVSLLMGHLVGSNRASWNDFCHTKNLKIPPCPIIRMQSNAIKR